MIYQKINHNSEIWFQIWKQKIVMVNFLFLSLACIHQDVLHLGNQELQEAATSAFIKIAEEQAVPHQAYAQTFLTTILQNVDSRDPGQTLIT